MQTGAPSARPSHMVACAWLYRGGSWAPPFWRAPSYIILSLSLSLSLSGFPRRQTTQPWVCTYQGKPDSCACRPIPEDIWELLYVQTVAISWFTWENASTWLESMALVRPRMAPCFMHICQESWHATPNCRVWYKQTCKCMQAKPYVHVISKRHLPFFSMHTPIRADQDPNTLCVCVCVCVCVSHSPNSHLLSK